MDSRMIDVAIGLVLVFALSGMAVTTLHEIYASLDKSRGKNLERAIGTMLQDTPGSQFTSLLLAHPLIVSLTDKPMIGQGKPSYIGADALVTALVARLAKLYCANVRPATPAELVAAARRGLGTLSNPKEEPSADLVSVMNTLLDGTETDWDTYLKRLSAWYDAVGERSIGWFKRATQMRLFILGLLLAGVVNINPFVIAPRLWNDKALREATVEAAKRAEGAFVAAGGASAPDNRELLASVLTALRPPPAASSAPSPSAGHAAIEAEVDARLAAFELGAVALANAQGERAGVLMLADIQRLLDLIPEISKFVKLRRTLALAGDTQGIRDAGTSIDLRVTQAGDLLGQPRPAKEASTPNGLSSTGPARSTAADAATTNPRAVADDKGKRALAKLGGSAKDTLLQAHFDLRNALGNEATRLLPAPRKTDSKVCPQLDDPAAKRLCEEMTGIANTLAPIGLPIGWTATNLPDCSKGPCVLTLVKNRQSGKPGDGKESHTPEPLVQGNEASETAALCLRDANCASVSLLGWAITALAAMLGAPFWFDFLGKLIKIRGSGAKPADEAGGDGPKSKTERTSLLSTPPQPTPGSGTQTMRDVQTVAEANLTPMRIREIQTGVLREFNAKPTGFFDEDTRQAIMAWQSSRSEPVTGELTQAQIELLLAPRPGDVASPASAPQGDAEEHVDGCDCDIAVATPDEALPPADGGVQGPVGGGSKP